VAPVKARNLYDIELVTSTLLKALLETGFVERLSGLSL
jgi:hypothetical protein